MRANKSLSEIVVQSEAIPLCARAGPTAPPHVQTACRAMTIQTGRGKRGGARPGLEDRRSRERPYAARQQRRSAVRAEFHRLCAATRCRVPLFRGPEVLSSRRALLRARLRDRSRQELSGARSRAGKGFSIRQDPRSPEAASRPPLSSSRHRALPRTHAAAYWASLGLPPETAKRNLQKCRVRIQSIDVQGATELGAALKGLGVRVVKRSADLTVTLVSDYLEARLAELNRQHLSDRTPWLLVQPSGIFPLVGPVFSPGQERLLDLSRRSDETQPRGQGVPRPQTGPLRRRFAARPRRVRTERHPACGRRDRESDRHRLSHGLARSHHQPRPVGLDHREALRGGPPAMPDLRPQGAARPAPRAGAGRAWRRRQAGHDERGIPDRFAAGHGCAFPQAREPAHRRGLASRADRCRPAHEHQLPCHAQFFRAAPRRSTSSRRD